MTDGTLPWGGAGRLWSLTQQRAGSVSSSGRLSYRAVLLGEVPVLYSLVLLLFSITVTSEDLTSPTNGSLKASDTVGADGKERSMSPVRATGRMQTRPSGTRCRGGSWFCGGRFGSKCVTFKATAERHCRFSFLSSEKLKRRNELNQISEAADEMLRFIVRIEAWFLLVASQRSRLNNLRIVKMETFHGF